MNKTTRYDDFVRAREANPIVSVCREIFADFDTPTSVYRKVANLATGTFLLESAEQGGVWTRFSFVGAGSFGVLGEAGGKARWKPAQGSALTEERLLPGGVAEMEPLEALEAVYQRWASAQVEGLPPLASGFVGFLGWETIRQILDVPESERPPIGIPVQGMSLVSDLIVIDHREGSMILIANSLSDDKTADPNAEWEQAQGRLDDLQRRLGQEFPSPLATIDREADVQVTSLTDSEVFQRDVRTAKERISRGELEQVVLSQRFDVDCRANPLDVYRVLRHLNPSPFLYLLALETNEGEPFHVVGSSPEALMTVNDGRVYTHPIAGSRPRGATHEEDQALEVELLADEKERAEHVMLVDLAKADLQRVCDASSVEVTEYMRVERFSHVMHIVSSVEGTLRDGDTAISALRATFPAGTLSGSPRTTAVELIDELEPTRRGVFGGVVGYFGLGGAADLAIAIRTATIRGGVAMVQAGAGIVSDSDPQKEDEECRNKAAAPVRAIGIANTLERLV